MYNKVTILPYVIPAKAGIQGKVTGFPRIKCGAGSIKHGITMEDNYKTKEEVFYYGYEI